MQNNEFKPASEKQIEYLQKLGYTGDLEGITMEEAAAKITELRGQKTPAPAAQPKQEVAPAGNNAVAPKKSFSVFMNAVGTKLVANAITEEKRKAQFIANIVSAVSNNPGLQECEQVSVLSAALQADALHFPVNNQLGYCYLVPYNDKKSGIKKAQFQIGYKGYIQLAIRSGQYLNIDVAEVKEGELKKYSPLRVDIEFEQDYEKRRKLKTIGYVGEFVLINGFTKSYFMFYDQMLDHANTYSQAFKADDFKKLMEGKVPEKDMWKYSSFWYKSFDEMAKKTIIRKLLSQWGIMSVEMQQAYENDMASFDVNTGKREYIDSKETEKANIEDVINMQQEQTGQKDLFDENGVVEDVNNI